MNYALTFIGFGCVLFVVFTIVGPIWIRTDLVVVVITAVLVAVPATICFYYWR